MISGTRFRLNLEVSRQARLAQDIAKAQAQIATGKRILTPSDDPTGSAQVAQIATTQADQAVWTRNVQAASVLAANADSALTSLATAIDRAKELMLTAATGTSSADNRSIIAAELRDLSAEITALRSSLDPRGEPLFRATSALEIPVGPNIRIAPVATRDAIFDGPVDLIAALDTAAAAAEEPDPALRSAACAASLSQIDGAARQVANVRADQGLRAARLDKVLDQLAESGIQLEEQKAGIEGTDVPATVAKLQSKQLSLEAAQGIFARINRSSLFDLLR
jgi:flagellar hook-associated protein 3 FlgL